MAVFKYPKGKRYRKANPKNRPPLKYDSRQPRHNIKFAWALYYKGDIVHHVVAYDIDNRFYIWNDGLTNHTVRNVSFCVKRLN